MSDEKSPDNMTPLERYLAKQRAEAGGAAPSGSAGESSKRANSKPDIDDPAIEAGAPAYPPPSSSSSPISNRFARAAEPEAELMSLVPADFWPRFGAYMIDLAAVGILTSVLIGVWSAVFFFLPHFLFGSWTISHLVVIFCYYGWFYAEKGASPGKMLLNLEIRESGTGRRLNYWKSFFRETVGKWISWVLMGLGFIIAAFRKDRLALHDMIFDTRVYSKETPKV